MYISLTPARFILGGGFCEQCFRGDEITSDYSQDTVPKRTSSRLQAKKKNPAPEEPSPVDELVPETQARSQPALSASQELPSGPPAGDAAAFQHAMDMLQKEDVGEPLVVRKRRRGGHLKPSEEIVESTVLARSSNRLHGEELAAVPAQPATLPRKEPSHSPTKAIKSRARAKKSNTPPPEVLMRAQSRALSESLLAEAPSVSTQGKKPEVPIGPHTVNFSTQVSDSSSSLPVLGSQPASQPLTQQSSRPGLTLIKRSLAEAEAVIIAYLNEKRNTVNSRSRPVEICS